MYNRYIPNGASYARIVEDDGPALVPPAGFAGPEREESPAAQPFSAPEEPPKTEPTTPGAGPEKKKTGLSALLKGLKLEDLDAGDLLLLLILLFLFLEGDDIELLITLGLLLVLGLE